jgi:hypothetical protein
LSREFIPRSKNVKLSGITAAGAVGSSGCWPSLHEIKSGINTMFRNRYRGALEAVLKRFLDPFLK